MPLVTVQTWVKSLLDGMAMPGPAGLGQLAAYINPPDPNDEGPTPTAYIWPTDGHEERQSVGRNTGPNTTAAWKNVRPNIDIYLTWFDDQDDPYIDNAFPSIIDAVMSVLRTSPDPQELVDPNSGATSWIAGLGERMTWQNLGVTSTSDQRWQRFDAIIMVSFIEYIQA